MRDLAIRLENRPGALAEMGEALGSAGVSIEDGGAFVVDGKGIAHFLFEDAVAARKALEEKGIAVLEDREVLVQRLNQDQPGQLGKIARMMAEAGVNIEIIYSDHQNQLILVVDDFEKGRAVSENWKRQSATSVMPHSQVEKRSAVILTADKMSALPTRTEGVPTPGLTKSNTTFVVMLLPGPAWNESLPMRAQAEWDDHARFMDDLMAKGFVIMGGPLPDSRERLLIVAAENEQTVRETLRRDPWHTAGILTTERIRPWTILLDSRRK